MENTPAISVIIAMYNSEKYVAKCLDSLLNQTMQDFEVIVVDDCSTDYSRAVVYSYFSKFHGKLKLFKMHQNNGLPGLPRNFALEKASGKYIYFLDSDDFLSETTLEELYNVAENFNADIVHVEKAYSFHDGEENPKFELCSIQTGEFVTEPILETSDIGERIMYFAQKRYLWWACNKLFLRQFLVDNSIKFTKVKVFEDMLFAFMCIVTAKVYVRVPFVNYYYRVRTNSVSHETRDIIEMSKNTFEVFAELDKFMDTQDFFQENVQYRYDVLNFFMQDRLEVFAKNLFVNSDLDPVEVFNFFRKNFFADNPWNYITLMSYLFVNANVFKLYSSQQESEIAELRIQVDELKKIIMEVVK